MLRSMDTAVAGLRSHQNKMDIVGHNIANVNTMGYKAQTYNFKEAMYQTATASTGGSGAGGVNAAQYGYGTMMGSIGVDMTASTPTYVGGFNASIDGSGFFMTKATRESVDLSDAAKVSSTVKKADFEFTRVGQFLVDNNGFIVDANGRFVYGFQPDTANAGKFVTTKMVPLRIPLLAKNTGTPDYTKTPATTTTEAEASPCVNIQLNNAGVVSASIKYEKDGGMTNTTIDVGKVGIATFQNPNGLSKSGGSYYKATESDNTGLVTAAGPGDAGTASLMGGFLEASNVDLAKEFSDMITTQRGFQANAKMITVSDEILQELVSMKR